MPLDWDDETKIAAKDELSRPTPQDRDRAYLIVLAGTSVGEMYKISKTEVVLGRGQAADVQVLDDGVSRRHAAIRVIDKAAQKGVIERKTAARKISRLTKSVARTA